MHLLKPNPLLSSLLQRSIYIQFQVHLWRTDKPWIYTITGIYQYIILFVSQDMYVPRNWFFCETSVCIHPPIMYLYSVVSSLGSLFLEDGYGLPEHFWWSPFRLLIKTLPHCPEIDRQGTGQHCHGAFVHQKYTAISILGGKRTTICSTWRALMHWVDFRTSTGKLFYLWRPLGHSASPLSPCSSLINIFNISSAPMNDALPKPLALIASACFQVSKWSEKGRQTFNKLRIKSSVCVSRKGYRSNVWHITRWCRSRRELARVTWSTRDSHVPRELGVAVTSWTSRRLHRQAASPRLGSEVSAWTRPGDRTISPGYYPGGYCPNALCATFRLAKTTDSLAG